MALIEGGRMAGKGPLPTGTARRRNKPTIPTTQLPASGFKGEVPGIPESYELHDAGAAFWSWAWSLPQAAAWDDGAVYAVARRAQLEDEHAALKCVQTDEIGALFGLADETEILDRISWIVGGLKALAGNATSLKREMRELDKRLGLDPKALAELRWTIVPDADAQEQKPERTAAQGSSSARRARLSVVS